MNKIQKQVKEDQGFFQLTFVKKSSNRRPKTSSLNRSSYNPLQIQKKYSQNDPLHKMKSLKQQAKKMERQYISMITNIKQSQKNINQNYKQAQKKKVSFIKLYQTKKLKNLQSNLINECKTERQKYYQQTRQQAKRRKLQEQIKHLVTKQEQETNLQKLRENIQKQKQKINNKKFIKTKQLFNNSRTSFLNIKQSEQAYKQRKKHIRSVSDVRSKHNYWKRVSQEIMMMEQYEKVIKQLEMYDNAQNQMEEIRAKTSQTARSGSRNGFFITQKR